MSAESSGPEPGPLCPEHGRALSWFCCSERRLVCAACTGLGGRCRGHRVRRAEERAEDLRVSGRGRRKAGGSEGEGRRVGERDWDLAETRLPARESGLGRVPGCGTRRLRVWPLELRRREFESRLPASLGIS